MERLPVADENQDAVLSNIVLFMTFGVRVPLILSRQAPDIQTKNREEIDAKAAAYLSEGMYKTPMPGLIVSGQKPHG